jgi:hypothetical protein
VNTVGRPKSETDGTISVHGGAKGPRERTPGCVRELWYRRFWLPEAYAICLSSDENVVAKEWFASW